MNKIILAGAALVITTGVALAQATDEQTTPPAAGPSAQDSASDPAAQPGMPGGMMMGQPGGMMGQGMRRRMMDDGTPSGQQARWMRQHRDRFMRGHGMMTRTKGAMFVFDRGGDDGRIVIKCADEDSTRSCAEAVQPLIDMMMQSKADE